MGHTTQRTQPVEEFCIAMLGDNFLVPGGKVIIEDVCGGDWEFSGQRVWMRQINPEARGEAFNGRATLLRLAIQTQHPVFDQSTAGSRSRAPETESRKAIPPTRIQYPATELPL